MLLLCGCTLFAFVCFAVRYFTALIYCLYIFLIYIIKLYFFLSSLLFVYGHLNCFHFLAITSYAIQFSSVAQSCPTLCNSMDGSTPGFPVHHQLPVYSDSCPLSQWCHPTISSSVVPFSSCLQSFPASGSPPMSQFFASGGQSIGASASASVLPVNIQDWFLIREDQKHWSASDLWYLMLGTCPVMGTGSRHLWDHWPQFPWGWQVTTWTSCFSITAFPKLAF